VLGENGIVGGLALPKYYADRPNEFLVCVTETNTKKQIDDLVEGLRSAE
jgi:glycine cleavage system pyridoxal-binding protein P